MSARPLALVAAAVAAVLALPLSLPIVPALAGPGPVVAAVSQRGVPTCHGQPATVVGTDGDDVLRGTPGPDVVWGGPGRDVLRGLEGDDVLCGGGGADRLYGGPGDDLLEDTLTGSRRQRLEGGAGPDRLVLGWRVRRGGEVVPAHLRVDLRAGQGVVEVAGERRRRFPLGSVRGVRALFSEGTWSVQGTAAAERFESHQYVSVRVRAGGGPDRLVGSWHDDVLRGGAGRDRAVADRGRDVCRSVERGPLDQCEDRS